MEMTITEYINLRKKTQPGAKRNIQDIVKNPKRWEQIPGLKSVRKVGRAYLLSIDEPTPGKE